MNYEQKYKEALERARLLYEQGTITESLSSVFPELAESEDERIRKEIIAIFKGQISFTSEEDDKKYIAWLEKQSEKPKWTEEDNLMIDSIIDTMKWLEGKGATDMKIDWLKTLKQKMQ